MNANDDFKPPEINPKVRFVDEKEKRLPRKLKNVEHLATIKAPSDCTVRIDTCSCTQEYECPLHDPDNLLNAGPNQGWIPCALVSKAEKTLTLKFYAPWGDKIKGPFLTTELPKTEETLNYVLNALRDRKLDNLAPK